MKAHYTLSSTFFCILIVICSVFFPLPLYSQQEESIEPLVSITPGRYKTAQLLSVTAKENTRVHIKLNGQLLLASQFPLLLDCNSGEEKTFLMEIVSNSIIPSIQKEKTYLYSWTIDKQSPQVPTYSIRSHENGAMLSFFLSEAGFIHYQLYQPTFDAYGQGSIKPGSDFFIPENTILCAFGVDLAGNKSASFSIDSSLNAFSSLVSKDSKKLPFTVINPISGNWSNKQVLVIEHEKDVMVLFSIDGSDPSITGLIYDAPVIIDRTGSVTIRIHAVHSDGKKWSSELEYSVTESIPSALSSIPVSSALIQIGEFSEILIPEGFAYSIGSSSSARLETPVTQGGKPLAISGIRGVSHFYPLTLTDGNLLWRWICSVGIKEEPVVSENSDSPVRMYDWHYVTVDLDTDVYYSIDESIWAPLEQPVFLSRKRKQVFKWYSPSFASGAVQVLTLPAKPTIQGNPTSMTTSSSVFLTINDPSYTYTYDAGSFYIPERPTLQKATLGSGLLVEIPTGATVPFNFRFSAYYEGLYHGDLSTSFVIDRSPPSKPTLQLTPNTNYSNIPVILNPVGEEKLILSIEPNSYTKQGSSFILEGNENVPVTYQISATAKDSAGNVSDIASKQVTVDRNALYVDASASNTENANGTPEFPYSTLDEALLRIRDTKKWRIYIRGAVDCSLSHTIQSTITISGENAVLSFKDKAQLFVLNGSLRILNCTINSDSSTSSSDTSLFSFQNAVFELTDSVVNVSDFDTKSILSSNSSNIAIVNSKLFLSSDSYALMFNTTASRLSLIDSSTQIESRNASVFSLTEGSLILTRVKSDVRTTRAARVIESWGAKISLDSVSLSRKDDSGNSIKNTDTALWYTGEGNIVKNKNVNIIGFAQSITLGNR